MRIVKLKCESDQASYDQTVREVAVESEDASNWYGNWPQIRLALFCNGQSSLGKKLTKTKGLGKRVNARLAQAPNFHPTKEKNRCSETLAQPQ